MYAVVIVDEIQSKINFFSSYEEAREYELEYKKEVIFANLDGVYIDDVGSKCFDICCKIKISGNVNTLKLYERIYNAPGSIIDELFATWDNYTVKVVEAITGSQYSFQHFDYRN